MSAKITVQEALNRADSDLKPKVAVLTASANSLRGAPTVEQVLTCNNNALIVMKAMDTFKRNVANTERPISLADGKKGLKMLKELQVSWNTVITETVNNKAAINALPVANLNALITQSLKDMYSTMIGVADVLENAAPAELLGEAKALRKEYEEALKKALAVYQ